MSDGLELSLSPTTDGSQTPPISPRQQPVASNSQPKLSAEFIQAQMLLLLSNVTFRTIAIVGAVVAISFLVVGVVETVTPRCSVTRSLLFELDRLLWRDACVAAGMLEHVSTRRVHNGGSKISVVARHGDFSASAVAVFGCREPAWLTPLQFIPCACRTY